MRTFKDKHGNKWRVKIDAAAMQRVKEFADVDLASTNPQGLLAMLANNPSVTVSVLFAVVQQQADDRAIDVHQFWDAVKGAWFVDAVEQFIQACIDSHRFGDRWKLRRAYKTIGA